MTVRVGTVKDYKGNDRKIVAEFDGAGDLVWPHNAGDLTPEQGDVGMFVISHHDPQGQFGAYASIGRRHDEPVFPYGVIGHIMSRTFYSQAVTQHADQLLAEVGEAPEP